MGVRSAELTKYAANCMLATKISFMNEMSNLAERLGADIEEVRLGIGSDSRIGYSFIYPGAGYGGSCFPKDVQALIKIAESNEYEPQILKAVNDVNDRQKRVLFEKLKSHFGGELTGRIVAIWGLAFKPNTDDIREAPALVLIESLLQAGAICQVYDPVAMENVRAVFGDRIIYVDHHYEALEEADALAILTEWAEFRNPDLNCLAQKMKHKVIFDGRNLLDCEQMRAAGFVYAGIGLNPLAATNPQPEDQVEV
jgi:UDPglucose 6-dehydrogenase